MSTVKYDPARGDVLITGAYDNTVRLFVGPNWTLVKTLAGHEGKVMCLDVAPGTCAMHMHRGATARATQPPLTHARRGRDPRRTTDRVGIV